ncbi:LCP family protein [Streptomyces sp. NPDC001941]|uniref:LCP family protein n=1 Tax=Streptomyces sp. NPDC001941 TaxID=3154659 RepID=UPI0033198A31
MALSVALALAAVTLGGGGWAYHHLDGNLRAVELASLRDEPRPSPLATGARTVLVLGSDSRAGENGAVAGAGGEADGGARSDVAMLVHLPEGRDRATSVSIPRDTLVDRPACTDDRGKRLAAARQVMFNSVYAQGGAACAVRAVEALSGMRVDHFAVVDFAGFRSFVDALGGVNVELDEGVEDPGTGLALAAGRHRLDGDRALALVRARHGVGDGGDLGRIANQQRVVRALLAELDRQRLLTQPVKLYRLASALTKSLTTDSELASLGSLLAFARSMQHIDPGKLTTVTLPVVPYVPNPDRLVPDSAKSAELWQRLKGS